jgi:hypothetical protein
MNFAHYSVSELPEQLWRHGVWVDTLVFIEVEVVSDFPQNVANRIMMFIGIGPYQSRNPNQYRQK